MPEVFGHPHFLSLFSPSEVIWSGTRLRDDRGPFRNAFAISLVRALVFRAQPLGCITWVSSKFLGGHNSQIIQVQVVMQNSSDSLENLSHVGCVWGWHSILQEWALKDAGNLLDWLVTSPVHRSKGCTKLQQAAIFIHFCYWGHYPVYEVCIFDYFLQETLVPAIQNDAGRSGAEWHHGHRSRKRSLEGCAVTVSPLMDSSQSLGVWPAT